MCKPTVRKQNGTDTWIWNCPIHKLTLTGFDDQNEAMTSAGYHALAGDPSPLIQTLVTQVVMAGNPRLTHMFDQLMGEIEKIKDEARSIATRLIS